MPGDIRLLVTVVNKKTQAAVFRAVVPGTKEPVKYESPVGSATIDQVEDISDKVKLVGGNRSEKTDKTAQRRAGHSEVHRIRVFRAAVGREAIAQRRSDHSWRRGVAAGPKWRYSRSRLLAQQVCWH